MMNEIIDQIFQQYSQYSNVDISLELIAVFLDFFLFGFQKIIMYWYIQLELLILQFLFTYW